MFNNIGGKIKTLAKVCCWIGIITSILIGLVVIFGGDVLDQILTYGYYYGGYGSATAGSVVLGIIIMAVGSLLSWIGSFFTYGFGQLIENTERYR